MVIGTEFSNVTDQSHLPTGTNPAYALASALSKQDEEDKAELLGHYQQALSAKQVSAVADNRVRASNGQKPKSIPQSLTESEIKALVAERDRLKQEVEEAKRQADTQALDEAEMAEFLRQEIEADSRKEIDALEDQIRGEAEKVILAKDRELKKKEAEVKAANLELLQFKRNPDPKTKQKIDDLLTKMVSLREDESALAIELKQLKEKLDKGRDAAYSVSLLAESVKQAIAEHHGAIAKLNNPSIPQMSLDQAEELANLLDDTSARIKEKLRMAPIVAAGVDISKLLNDREGSQTVIDIQAS
ncbi:MAG: hypothetical protein AAGD25_06820 [Cyanobacteria bacterium P01_F01_bin.150]